jgi:branched-chain amino acid transport system substrate-binding protein
MWREPRSVRAFLAVAVVAALATACSGSGIPGTSGQQSTGPDLLLGAALSITGSTSNEGGLIKQGYDMWADWVNGQGGITVQGVRHKVRIKYVDDESSPSLTAQLTQELIRDDKVRFLLGPYGTDATVAAAPVADQHRVVMIDTSGSSRAIFSHGYRYIFGIQTPADLYFKSVLDMAAAMRPKPATVAILSADDGFSQQALKGVLDYAPTKGLQIVFNQTYKSGTTNLYGQLATARDTKPDLLLNSGHLQEAIAINKAAMDLRLNAKLFAYTIGPATPSFTQELGKAADYVVDPSQWTAAVQYNPEMYLTVPQYVQAYQRRYNTTAEPAFQVAQSTAAGLVLQRAIQNANSLDQDKVRNALAGLDFTSFFGRIKFNGAGQNTYKPMVVEQIQYGRRITVFPSEVASAALLYPTPDWTSRTGVPPQAPQPVLPGTGAP